MSGIRIVPSNLYKSLRWIFTLLIEYGLNMKRSIKTASIIIVLLSLFSCNWSPQIDFQSYKELSGYDFIDNGWFPEILGNDSYNILETYDLYNNHSYGKFDFKQRSLYDSIIRNYQRVKVDTLLSVMNKIRKPRYPSWFIQKAEVTGSNYVLAKQNNFYLLMEKKTNRIYFFR